MLLAVDLGIPTPSSLSMTEMIVEGLAMRYDPRRTADEYAVWLIDLMALKGLVREVVTDAIVSSVVPGQLQPDHLCKRYFECDPMFIGEDDCDLTEALIDRPIKAVQTVW